MSSFWPSACSYMEGPGIVRLTDVDWPEDMTLVYSVLGPHRMPWAMDRPSACDGVLWTTFEVTQS